MPRQPKRPQQTLALREPHRVTFEHVVFADEGEMVAMRLGADPMDLIVYFKPDQFKTMWDQLMVFTLERTEGL